MAKNLSPTIPIKLFGSSGSNPIPLIEKLWDFYAQKGIKTVFVSLGTSSSPLGELEISETLGCPINIVEPSNEKKELWNKVVEILKERTVSSEQNSCDFTNDVQNKWVLPKNVRVSSRVPHFYSGVIDISDISIGVIDFKTYIETICESMNISKENARIDLLNIQLGSSLEESVIYSLTHSPYRPGLIIVNYTQKPDSNLFTSQVASHLQNIGYSLIGKEENKFVYLYNDKNVYEFASYEDTTVDNPLIYEIIKSTGFYSSKKVDA